VPPFDLIIETGLGFACEVFAFTITLPRRASEREIAADVPCAAGDEPTLRKLAPGVIPLRSSGRHQRTFSRRSRQPARMGYCRAG